MKLLSYSKTAPLAGFCSQYAILASNGEFSRPLVYLQRPRWIKDDAQWEAICIAVRINLPAGFEVTE